MKYFSGSRKLDNMLLSKLSGNFLCPIKPHP